jgi:predicted ester cyclase
MEPDDLHQLDRIARADAERRVMDELRRLTSRGDVFEWDVFDEEEWPGSELLRQALDGRLDALDDVCVVMCSLERRAKGTLWHDFHTPTIAPRRVRAGPKLRSAFVGVEENKALVRRLVDEGVNKRNPDVLDEVAAGPFAAVARRWVAPFRGAFPDFTMEIVGLVAEGDTVVAHFKCSGTHEGEWLGVPATGRRFEGVDEIYVFEVQDGKLSSAMGVEDNLTRIRQLGLAVRLAATTADAEPS